MKPNLRNKLKLILKSLSIVNIQNKIRKKNIK